MPTIEVNGASFWYEDSGAPDGADPDAAPLLLLHGFLFGGHVFDAQVAELSRSHRCITLDLRGQGDSQVTRGGYLMESAYADVLAVIRRLGLGPCHVVGLSMGGFIALRLAARHPELVRSQVLIGSSADVVSRSLVPEYLGLAAVARLVGLDLLSGIIERGMYGRSYLHDPASAAARYGWRMRRGAVNRRATSNVMMGIVLRPSVLPELDAVQAPTLVIVGSEDSHTPPAQGRAIAERIPGARLVILPGVGHTAPLEAPAAVTAEIGTFLGRLSPTGPMAESANPGGAR